MIEILDDPAPAAEPSAGLVDAATIAAAAADQPAAPGAAPGSENITSGAPAAIDPAAEARDLVEFANTLIVPLYPSLATIYTADVRARIAAATAPVLQKYGFSLADFFGKWAPEIGLGMTVIPLLPATLAAIRADRAALDNAKSHTAKNDKQTEAARPATQGEPAGAVNPLLDRLHQAEVENGKRAD